MIDLDIPTDNPPATNTLLHWLQTGLVPLAGGISTAPNGSAIPTVYPLSNPTNESALAPYAGPNPPARVPLSHRYVQILVDTSAADAAAIGVLRQAATTRRGFNASRVLAEAGLAGKVVAGNFYNVTNAGPAATAPAPSSSTAGGGSATQTTGGAGQPTVSVAVAAGRNVVGGVAGVVALGVLFAGL